MTEIEDRSGAASPELERISGDAAGVHALALRPYEADLGLLTASLEPVLRPKLVEMMESEFDCAALTEMNGKIRDEILAELQNETVAEGVRDAESGDAASALEDLQPEDQAEILERDEEKWKPVFRPHPALNSWNRSRS